MSEAIGDYVVIKSCLDYNHASNMGNRTFHYGIIIYVKNTFIMWYSKCYNTVEASSFGLEFLDFRITTKMIEALRYKLRCFGVPVDDLGEVF